MAIGKHARFVSEIVQALPARSPARWIMACAFWFVMACSGTHVSKAPAPAVISSPVTVTSADASVTLVRIHGAGDKESLVEDPGWQEYILEVQNFGTGLMIVLETKLLTPSGRYVPGASAYEEITVPPDLGTEVAGEVAKTTAGMAAGHFIPYGGQIFGVLSGAASSSGTRSRAIAEREFSARVLNQMELAPGGRATGSAFLPNVPGARALVVSYNQGGIRSRLELPLPAK